MWWTQSFKFEAWFIGLPHGLRAGRQKRKEGYIFLDIVDYRWASVGSFHYFTGIDNELVV